MDARPRLSKGLGRDGYSSRTSRPSTWASRSQRLPCVDYELAGMSHLRIAVAPLVLSLRLSDAISICGRALREIAIEFCSSTGMAVLTTFASHLHCSLRCSARV